MDRRRLLRPMGPLPPSVYWMRRAALAFIGVGVLVLVAVLVLRAIPGSSATGDQRPPATTPTTVVPTAPTSPPTTPAATTTTATPTPGATAALPACVGADLTVTVTSVDRTYAAGAEPEFVATVKPASPCRAAAPGFEVTSGPERIWASADCAPAAATTIAGSYQRSTHWDLTRSNPGCASVVGTTTATAGTYHVVATVAGVTSAPVRFALS